MPVRRAESKPRAAAPLPLGREHARCVDALDRAGVLTPLPKSGRPGVVGIDGREYPAPGLEQVAALIEQSRDLVGLKVAQGFDRLELTPMAMPVRVLIELLRAAITRRAAGGGVYRTRRSPDEALTPVRVNAEKQVWVWETLSAALDSDALAYFPQVYGHEHFGQTKAQVIGDPRACAIPGWSVGLVESQALMPQAGQGQTRGGRRQLEVGLSPREYLNALQAQAHHGETGRTLEDFITAFLTRLTTTGEVSHDVSDNNALWLLGHYLKVPYADLVPTGRWIRDLGRVRLDLHRSGNKLCTKSFGAATTVRRAGVGG